MMCEYGLTNPVQLLKQYTLTQIDLLKKYRRARKRNNLMDALAVQHAPTAMYEAIEEEENIDSYEEEAEESDAEEWN